MSLSFGRGNVNVLLTVYLLCHNFSVCCDNGNDDHDEHNVKAVTIIILCFQSCMEWILDN